jgi:hypothetical protein
MLIITENKLLTSSRPKNRKYNFSFRFFPIDERALPFGRFPGFTGLSSGKNNVYEDEHVAVVERY